MCKISGRLWFERIQWSNKHQKKNDLWTYCNIIYTYRLPKFLWLLNSNDVRDGDCKGRVISRKWLILIFGFLWDSIGHATILNHSHAHVSTAYPPTPIIWDTTAGGRCSGGAGDTSHVSHKYDRLHIPTIWQPAIITGEAKSIIGDHDVLVTFTWNSADQ